MLTLTKPACRLRIDLVLDRSVGTMHFRLFHRSSGWRALPKVRGWIRGVTAGKTGRVLAIPDKPAARMQENLKPTARKAIRVEPIVGRISEKSNRTLARMPET